MTAINLQKKHLLIFGLPLLIVLSAVYLCLSPLLVHHPELAVGITYDLCLTLPLVYFFMIRKRAIPKITVVPFFVIGVLLATFLLPDHLHFHLDLVKTFLFPVVELTVLSLVLWRVRKAILVFRQQENAQGDFYELFVESARAVLPNERIAQLFTTEVSMIYYALFAWKKNKSPGFTHYKKSGLLALLGAVIFIILIETFVLHLFLLRWNEVVAWVLFGLSLYTGLQIFGHIKALTKRKSFIQDGYLHLKYGLFGDTRIPIAQISKVEKTRKKFESEEVKVCQLALLGELEGHNLILHLKETQQLQSAYGITKLYDVLMLNMDDLDHFCSVLEENQ